MKTIILYYSYTGHTKKIAEKKALETGADIEEISEVKKLSKLKAYFSGSFRAMKQKKAQIHPLKANLENYEKIIIMAPIWAGSPAPAFNNIIELLPAGKKVELVMVSAGGETNKTEKIKNLVTSRGCDVISYSDIKA